MGNQPGREDADNVDHFDTHQHQQQQQPQHRVTREDTEQSTLDDVSALSHRQRLVISSSVSAGEVTNVGGVSGSERLVEPNNNQMGRYAAERRQARPDEKVTEHTTAPLNHGITASAHVSQEHKERKERYVVRTPNGIETGNHLSATSNDETGTETAMAAEVSEGHRRRRQRGLASSTGMMATTGDGLDGHHQKYSAQYQQPQSRDTHHHQLISNESQATSPVAEENQRRAVYAQQMLLNRQPELRASTDSNPTVTVPRSTTLLPANEVTSISSMRQPIPGSAQDSNFKSPRDVPRAVTDDVVQSDTKLERTLAVTPLMTSATMLDDESRRQRRRAKQYSLIGDREDRHSKNDSRPMIEHPSAAYSSPHYQASQITDAESTSSNTGLLKSTGSRQVEAGSNCPLRTEVINNSSNVQLNSSASSTTTRDVIGHDTSVVRHARRPRDTGPGRGLSKDTASTNWSIVSGEHLVTPSKSMPALVAESAISMSTPNTGPATVIKKQYAEAPSRMMAPAAATSPTTTRRTPRSALSADHRSTGVTSQLKEVTPSTPIDRPASSRGAINSLTPFSHRSHHQRERDELASLGASMLLQQAASARDPPTWPSTTTESPASSTASRSPLPTSSTTSFVSSPTSSSTLTVTPDAHRSTLPKRLTDDLKRSSSLTPRSLAVSSQDLGSEYGSCASIDSMCTAVSGGSTEVPTATPSPHPDGSETAIDSDTSSDARRRRRAALVRSRAAAASAASSTSGSIAAPATVPQTCQSASDVITDTTSATAMHPASVSTVVRKHLMTTSEMMTPRTGALHRGGLMATSGVNSSQPECLSVTDVQPSSTAISHSPVLTSSSRIASGTDKLHFRQAASTDRTSSRWASPVPPSSTQSTSERKPEVLATIPESKSDVAEVSGLSDSRPTSQLTTRSKESPLRNVKLAVTSEDSSLASSSTTLSQNLGTRPHLTTFAVDNVTTGGFDHVTEALPTLVMTSQQRELQLKQRQMQQDVVREQFNRVLGERASTEVPIVTEEGESPLISSVIHSVPSETDNKQTVVSEDGMQREIPVSAAASSSLSSLDYESRRQRRVAIVKSSRNVQRSASAAVGDTVRPAGDVTCNVTQSYSETVEDSVAVTDDVRQNREVHDGEPLQITTGTTALETPTEQSSRQTDAKVIDTHTEVIDVISSRYKKQIDTDAAGEPSRDLSRHTATSSVELPSSFSAGRHQLADVEESQTVQILDPGQPQVEQVATTTRFTTASMDCDRKESDKSNELDTAIALRTSDIIDKPQQVPIRSTLPPAAQTSSTTSIDVAMTTSAVHASIETLPVATLTREIPSSIAVPSPRECLLSDETSQSVRNDPTNETQVHVKDHLPLMESTVSVSEPYEQFEVVELCGTHQRQVSITPRLQHGVDYIERPVHHQDVNYVLVSQLSPTTIEDLNHDHSDDRTLRHVTEVMEVKDVTLFQTDTIGLISPPCRLRMSSNTSYNGPDSRQTLVKRIPTCSRLIQLRSSLTERTFGLDHRVLRNVTENQIVKQETELLRDTFKSVYPSVKVAPKTIGLNKSFDGRQNLVFRQLTVLKHELPVISKPIGVHGNITNEALHKQKPVVGCTASLVTGKRKPEISCVPKQVPERMSDTLTLDPRFQVGSPLTTVSHKSQLGNTLDNTRIAEECRTLTSGKESRSTSTNKQSLENIEQSVRSPLQNVIKDNELDDNKQTVDATSIQSSVQTTANDAIAPRTAFPRLVTGRSWQAVVEGKVTSSSSVACSSGAGDKKAYSRPILLEDDDDEDDNDQTMSDNENDNHIMSTSLTNLTSVGGRHVPTPSGSAPRPILRRAKTFDSKSQYAAKVPDIDPELSAVLQLRKQIEEEQQERDKQQQQQQQLAVENRVSTDFKHGRHVHRVRRQRSLSAPTTVHEHWRMERLQTVASFRANVVRHPAVLPLLRRSMKTSGRSIMEAFPLSFANQLQCKHRRRGQLPHRRCRTPPGDFIKNIFKSTAGLIQTKRTLALSYASNVFQNQPVRHQRALPVVSRNLPSYCLDEDSLDDLVETNVTAADNRADSTLDVGMTTASSGSLWTLDDDQTSKSENKNEAADELCKLSLADKRKLFSEKTEDSSPTATPTSTRKDKSRRQARFKTQPVTPDELEKAVKLSRISPLALTMVKPPAPEYLATMPVKDQRQFVADWAAANLTTALNRRQQQQTNDASDEAQSDSSSSATTVAAFSEKGQAPPNKRSQMGTISSSTPVRGILKSSSSAVESPKSSFDIADPPPAIHSDKNILNDTSTQQRQMTSQSRGILRKQKSNDMENEYKAVGAESYGNVQMLTEVSNERKLGATDVNEQVSDVTAMTEQQQQQQQENNSGVTMRMSIKNKAIARRRMMSEKQRLDESTGETATKTSSKSLSLTSGIDEATRRRLLGAGTGSFDNDITDDAGSWPPSGTRREEQLQLESAEDADEGNVSRPKSIAERLSRLFESRDSWKAKVEEKDVAQFTVEGKITRLGVSTESSLQQRANRSKNLSRARSTPNLSSGLNEDEETERAPLPEVDCTRANRLSTRQDGRRHGASSAVPGPITVAVPRFDDEESLAMFFDSNWRQLDHRRSMSTRSGRVWCPKPTINDFDLVEMMCRDRLTNPRRPNPPMRQFKSRGNNPLRNLLKCGLLRDEYLEIRSDIATRELKRIKHEQILGTTHFAQEALAGLASKEDFTNVSLRKTDPSTRSITGEYLPYSDLMLLHVKGRRCCQTRLVEPRVTSVNSGDCFVLVTSDRVLLWTGEYCNIIEKAKATDVANQIFQKHDLGCSSNSELDIIAESLQVNTISSPSRAFWKLLGSDELAASQAPGRYDEDELYETYISETNVTYRLVDEELLVADEYSGRPLKHDMLRSKEIYVFDFGSEMYVWTGKHVQFGRRKKALRLALDLWDRGYDYTGYDINPLSPLLGEESGGLPLESTARPDWALFAKINQNMETVLFKEKFVDWPDSTRLIKVKGTSKNGENKSEAVVDLKPCDAKLMIPVSQNPVSLLLDGGHVGRGIKWEEMQAGIRRSFEIITHSIDMWHVLEYNHHRMPETSHGQFHEADTYVIRWHYSTLQIGSRTLRGEESRQSLVGRTRCAYFFWQGRNSSINEKGASALMTVELDEERGPQVRVVQGKEPPCFINLFRGRMIVHCGKRVELADGSPVYGPSYGVGDGLWRLYAVRNELPGEAYLHEVAVEPASLRSRTSFLLLGLSAGVLFLWHGIKSSPAVVRRAQEITMGLLSSCPGEIGLHDEVQKLRVLEMIEGCECPSFWSVFGADSPPQRLYHSLVGDCHLYNFSPRLFFMSSVSGVFEAVEVINPAINHENTPSAFPFIQSDLYNEVQPALFLVDNGHAVYLWQGWWPTQDPDDDDGLAADSVRTGSTEARFLANRKCAMETTLLYCQAVNTEAPPTAYLVYAGLEPLVFTNLFPIWETDETITQLSIADGKQPGNLELVSETLSKLCQTRYSWEELQRRPLPDGVDPLRLEFYITDEEFEEVVGLTREEFSTLPIWKQANIKKEVGLF